APGPLRGGPFHHAQRHGDGDGHPGRRLFPRRGPPGQPRPLRPPAAVGQQHHLRRRSPTIDGRWAPRFIPVAAGAVRARPPPPPPPAPPPPKRGERGGRQPPSSRPRRGG